MQFQAAALLFYCSSARILIFFHWAGMSRGLHPIDEVVCLERSMYWGLEGGRKPK